MLLLPHFLKHKEQRQRDKSQRLQFVSEARASPPWPGSATCEYLNGRKMERRLIATHSASFFSEKCSEEGGLRRGSGLTSERCTNQKPVGGTPRRSPPPTSPRFAVMALWEEGETHTVQAPTPYREAVLRSQAFVVLHGEATAESHGQKLRKARLRSPIPRTFTRE